jgi:hypothetical protein
MPVTINGFRLVSVVDTIPPHLIEYNIINQYQIYRSTFNTELYVIFDNDYNVYRCIEFLNNNSKTLNDNLDIYIDVYYAMLEPNDKSTLTPKI